MQIEPSKARILADCIEGMAADAEDKGKESFGIHLSLDDAHMITRALSTAPTVDAVPVVRCGECIYFDPEGYGGASCAETGAMIWPNEDDYCSRGQRRDQFAGSGNMDGGGADAP